MGYCGLMKKQYGQFSITSISYINNTISAIDSNAYKNANNKEMIELVDKTKNGATGEQAAWDSYFALKEKYSPEEIKEFASNSIKNDKNYIKYLVNKTIDLAKFNIGTTGYVGNKTEYAQIKYNNIATCMMPINFGAIYIISAISMIYLIIRLLKYKKMDWIVAFLVILIVANIFTLVVGAPFEQQRLFVSSIALVWLLIGYYIAKLIENRKQIKDIFYKLFLEKTDNGKMQFFRYIFVGGFAAIVNIGSLYVFKEFLQMYYLLANVLGFILGLITNYILSKWLVFAKEKSMNAIVEFAIYAIIGVLGLIFDTFFIWIFTTKMQIYYMISKIISTGLVFIWNFLARKCSYIIVNKIRSENKKV